MSKNEQFAWRISCCVSGDSTLVLDEEHASEAIEDDELSVTIITWGRSFESYSLSHMDQDYEEWDVDGFVG